MAFQRHEFDDFLQHFLQQPASFPTFQDTLEDNFNWRLWSLGIGDGTTILIKQ
jgi:hypothetical protein